MMITSMNFLSFKMLNEIHKIIRLTDCYPLSKLLNMKRKKTDKSALIIEWRTNEGVVIMNYLFEDSQVIINYIVERIRGMEMIA